MSEVERFVSRLGEALNRHPRHGSNDDYLTTNTLQRAIAQAMQPENLDEQFPRMLYMGNQTRTVNSAEEGARATAEGFGRIPPPQYEEDFPKWYVERPVSEGGWKVWDNRRVMILTPEEEAQFYSAIEENDWISDSVENRFGARGFGLSDLIAERKAQLKAMIDQEPLTMSDTPASEEAAPVESVPEGNEREP